MPMTESLPVMLIPGLNCTARLYADQLPALWTFGPVKVADHRRGDSVEIIARQILNEAPKKFALVGLSMGGYVALAIMRLAPERVVKLALLDTGARSDTPEQRERRTSQIAAAQAGQFDATSDALWPILVHKNRLGDGALKQVVVDMAGATGAEAFVNQQRAIMTRPDSRPGLSAIGCPTLVLVGDGDQLTPPHLSEEMAGLIANSRLVTIPDSGHLSTLERPEAVTRALVEWMR